jgi:hypothetical protein
MVTVAEFKAVFGVTNEQLQRAGEWMDAVTPKPPDAAGNPQSNGLDDLVAYMLDDLRGKYIHWKRDQAAVTF